MKKGLLFGLALGVSMSGVIAQNTPVQGNVHTKKEIKFSKHGVRPTGEIIPSYANSPAYTPGATAANEDIIGETKYDLQSNTAMARRIILKDDGSLAAGWTYSDVTTFADRGTGYNYFDGSVWGPAPNGDYVESTRTGWPSIQHWGTNGVMAFSHGNNVQSLMQNTSSTVASPTWSESELQVLRPMILWPRMATGGANNDVVHVIGRSDPADGTTDAAYGMTGVALYSRSSDGGATWDIVNFQLPGMDATNYVGIGADDYAIEARGDVVAVVYGGLGDGVAIWKSYDAGTTWEMMECLIPSLHRFDEAAHLVIDTTGGVDGTGADFQGSLPSSDGTVGVLIDNDDMCHVWYGYQEVSNDDITDGNLSYYPALNGIGYWNENMPASLEATFCAWAPDLNGNGQLDIPIANNAAVTANYRFAGVAHQPMAGIDANGCMYMIYTGIVDTLYAVTTATNENLRHIFGVQSCDGGCTWSSPVDLTPNSTNTISECAYPSIAAKVDGSTHFIYQRDAYPGSNLIDAATHPVTDNEIVYVNAATSEYNSDDYVCLGSMVAPNKQFCYGDSVSFWMSCDNGTYQWYKDGAMIAGATASSLTIDTFAVFTVEVITACGDTAWYGDTTWSSAASAPVVDIWASETEVCAGGGLTIDIETEWVSSASYIWSEGSTTDAIAVTAPGTYTVTITNCGGSSSGSVTIGTISAPTGGYSASGSTSFCEGAETLTLSADDGTAWVWLEGVNIYSTSSSISLATVAESGNYTLITYNACGDSVIAGPETVTISTTPGSPVITFDEAAQTYTSDITGGNQWYVNGIAQAGETGDTFTPSGDDVLGLSIYCVNTDAGSGCASGNSNSFTKIEEVGILSSQLVVYPNPNKGSFAIQFAGVQADDYLIEVKNVLGQIVFTQTTSVNGNYILDIDLTSVEKGAYFLTLTNSTDEFSQKLIIE